MKIELEISVIEAQGIIEYLEQNNDANKGTGSLYKVIDAVYTKICKHDRENEAFRKVIEGFLVYNNHPASPDPEEDPSLYNDEEIGN